MLPLQICGPAGQCAHKGLFERDYIYEHWDIVLEYWFNWNVVNLNFDSNCFVLVVVCLSPVYERYATDELP